MIGEVVIVVDERDDVHVMRAALDAHQPACGRITVTPTPSSDRPAALAHDLLYALGKRLNSGPGAADARLDSVAPAWHAAAAWTAAMGVRHIVVTRAHLLTARRIDHLLAWRETTGIQLTLLWQASQRRLPPGLAGMRHRSSSPDQLEQVLHAPGPLPPQPSFPPTPPAPASDRAVAQGQPAAQHKLTWPRPEAAGPVRPCAGAAATARHVVATPARGVAAADVAALTRAADPLIAAALSVLGFTGIPPGTLRWIRDLDVAADVDTLKTHTPAHLDCRLHAVPAWVKPLLAAVRAHHRLAGHRPGECLFTPVLVAGARPLRALAARLPTLDLDLSAHVLVA